MRIVVLMRPSSEGISAQIAMWTRPAPWDETFTSRWRQRSERIEPRTYFADASVDPTDARKVTLKPKSAVRGWRFMPNLAATDRNRRMGHFICQNATYGKPNVLI